MKKADFTRLFDRIVYGIAGAPAPKRFSFHGCGLNGELIGRDEAIGRLWLGPNRFFRIIDVAMLDGHEGPQIFVRPSGHQPGPWGDTFAPDGDGPFRALGQMQRGKV